MRTTELMTILRLPKVLEATGVSCTTHYQRMADGLFVRPIPIGARAVGWPLHEVNEINTARIAGKSEDEIRALVKKLESARKALA